MITVISGTNRLDSYTKRVANQYSKILKEMGEEVRFFSLEDLPKDFISSDLYGNRSSEFQSVLDEMVVPVNKFVFIIPEYNGSFPGVVKTFIDGIPPKFFHTKKVGLIGVSSGQAGNLRGQEHLTGIFQYLKMFVHYNKLKISHVDKVLDADGLFTSEADLNRLIEHATQMSEF